MSQILARCSLFGGIQRQTRNGSFIKEVTEVREILSSSGISPFFPSRISHYQCAFLFRYLNFASMLEYIHLAGICYIVKFYCNWQFRVALSLEFCILFLLKCLLPCSGDICQSEQNEKKGVVMSSFQKHCKETKDQKDRRRSKNYSELICEQMQELPSFLDNISHQMWEDQVFHLPGRAQRDS